MRVDLGNRVRVDGLERRRLPLRRLGRDAEHLRRRGLKDARLRPVLPYQFEHAVRADRVRFAGLDRGLPRQPGLRLSGEIVDFRHWMVLDCRRQRIRVAQVAVADLDLVAQRAQRLASFKRVLPAETDDAVVFLQQKFGQKHPVLAGDAEDQGGFFQTGAPRVRVQEMRSEFCRLAPQVQGDGGASFSAPSGGSR